MQKLDEKGQGLTEYMILLILVSLAAVGVAKGLGGSIKSAIRRAQQRISTQITFKEANESQGLGRGLGGLRGLNASESDEEF